MQLAQNGRDQFVLVALQHAIHRLGNVLLIHRDCGCGCGGGRGLRFEQEMRQAFEASGDSAVVPAREPEPDIEVGIDTQPLEIFAEPQAAPLAEIEAAPEHPAENHELTQKLVSQFAAELEAAQREAPPELHDMEPPAAAAIAPAITMDEQHVAEVVDRVLERYKDELVAAILRELQS